MDEATIQYLNRKAVYSIEWIEALNSSMMAAESLARNFTQWTIAIVFTLATITFGGALLASMYNIDWLSYVLMAVGIIFMVVYTIVAIIRFKKNAKDIRTNLDSRIDTAKRDHHVKVEEVFLLSCSCCPPILPAALKIFIDTG